MGSGGRGGGEVRRVRDEMLVRNVRRVLRIYREPASAGALGWLGTIQTERGIVRCRIRLGEKSYGPMEEGLAVFHRPAQRGERMDA